MLIYWLLFGMAAVLALFFPFREGRMQLGVGHTLAMIAFVLFYASVATLRHEIGGDWETYATMYGFARQSTFTEIVQFTDPLFGVILWVAARLGTDQYLPNGLCAAIMVWGVVRLAMTTREPWLAILSAVPYLLVVVGMGYVRQAGAMGLVMAAMAGIDHRARWATFGMLFLAAGLHLTAGVVFPLFAMVMARRNMALVSILGLVGFSFAGVLMERLNTFQDAYLGQSYDSSGAGVRLAMSVLPSLLLLVRWKRFDATGMLRSLWLLVAVTNIGLIAALYLSPSSTAVDRVALYFAPVQMVVFGSLVELTGVGRRGAYGMRIASIMGVGVVQVVWLVMATFAELWVPYKSIAELI
ncbi:hypothetical protein GTZ99_00055 [Novosphingobium sp. FSY-8]|uniref:EpsG-like glucosyltransferase n=1 Tax=Novosphingobium ovatum TaxID=1908523 RepID=A0ABW9X8U0_9SPHN|nr:EpsG family protein [Novosphingobium ovatum]NBC34945.1 hypothetical protein [Novosphingobium ovatum]